MWDGIGEEHRCSETPDMPRTTYVDEESGKIFRCSLSGDRGCPLSFCSCLCVFTAPERFGPDIPESPILHQEGV